MCLTEKTRVWRISIAATALCLIAPGYPQAAPANSTVESREVNYQIEGKPFRGYLVAPHGTGKVPGVLVVHEWWGHNEYARYRARKLAESGYAAFALDIYGEGKTTDNPEEAGRLMQAAIDSGKIPERFEQALQVLRSDPRVDPDRIGAIGYCFGGSVVLTMALRGEPLKGVVSFQWRLRSDSGIPAQRGQGQGVDSPRRRGSVYTGRAAQETRAEA